MSKKDVIVGPLRLALRYVRRRRLCSDDVIVVSDAHALHHIDPVDIGRIILLAVHRLPAKALRSIVHELGTLRRLWQIRIIRVPVLT